MKKTIYVLFVILFISCHREFQSSNIWTVEFDTVSSSFYMKERSNQKTQSADQIVQMINRENPSIQIELCKVSNDTAYVRISDGEFLTQQSGTAGADSYLAIVVYNLSEFENIEYINFDFEPGDHAMPGTYSRKDFINF